MLGMLMSTSWIEKFVDARVLPQFDRIILQANRRLRGSLEHQSRYRWHPISTAPYNQDLELRIIDGNEAAEEVLPFPCRHLNSGGWWNPDLGVRLQINPIEWGVWQKSVSPQTALLIHNPVGIDLPVALRPLRPQTPGA
jgi:hypothetical protein